MDEGEEVCVCGGGGSIHCWRWMRERRCVWGGEGGSIHCWRWMRERRCVWGGGRGVVYTVGDG